MSDISSVLIWWLTIFTIGAIFVPVTFQIFHKFVDHGYIFSKVVGILISSYLIWLLASLHILPFTKITVIIILIGSALLNMFLWSNLSKKGLLAKLPIGLILFEELLFLLTLAFWSYVKATEPSIHGLEKFMDFGFVNSILRSNYFPPLDMWLARSPDYTGGYFINYYYFGHYIATFLTKLSGIDSAVTYNLMIATLFAFTFTLSFSLGLNLYYLYILIKSKAEKVSKLIDIKIILKKAILAGLLSGFLVALGGNLHTIYTLTSNYPLDNPVPPWKLALGIYPERYWYPNATRFIPFTIHEFPIYSFVVSDLHGHVSDIPFVLLFFAILLSIIISCPQLSNLSNLGGLSKLLYEFENHTSISFPKTILLGTLLSVMYMTNAWDGLIYMILVCLVFLYINIRTGEPIFTSLYKTFSATLFLVFFFLLASLPFSLNFRPFVSGIGVLCAPKILLEKKLGPLLFEEGKCQKSPIWMLFFLWGFFYYNVLGFLIFVIIPKLKEKLTKHKAVNSSRPACAGRQARTIKYYSSSDPQADGESRSFGNINPVNVFVMLLIFISTLLLIFPEFFYMKDIYPAHYRANTMFKLGYQAFMMLGLVSAFIIIRLRDDFSGPKRIGFIVYRAIFFILFLLVGIYPYFAINSYFGGLKTYRGLNGLNWFSPQYADDLKAIQWLRNNVTCNDVTETQCSNHPVIAEASGDSYTDYARVSANTGLPTIVGWPVHEWLWRGSYDEAGRRIPEVAAIYESKDMKLTLDILKKYNVEYIFLGSLEKEKYKNLNPEKLNSLGKVVFESGGTKVIKVNLISS